MKNDPKIQLLLARTNLKIPFVRFIAIVEEMFLSIGTINSFLPISEGYEDANFILDTTTGKYVLKIFLKSRTIKNINSYIKILTECKKIGFPTTEVVKDFNEGLGFVEDNGEKIYFIITKFFNGSNFQRKSPTLEDIKIITAYMSKLNTLNFDIDEEYDSWGNKNFAKEYKENKNKITPEQNRLIEPIYQKLIKLNLSSFSKSVIHGDMQRKHVLKDNKNNYCIFDFGCMANDLKVIDLSTFLAWFCFQKDTWGDKEEIYREVLNIYNRIHHLTESEIESLPTLVKASYGAYFLKTSVLINERDNSDETLDWHNRAGEMLKLTSKWE